MRSFAIALFGLLALSSCEKEISINVPPVASELVVEASINQAIPTLNYVFINRTIDYFNPQLNLNGLNDAEVYITEGSIQGTDTLYSGTRWKFSLLSDSLLPGVYANLTFTGKENTPYKLDISMPDGKKVSGTTFIGKPPVIDSMQYWFQIEGKDTNSFFWMQWFDGPEQNNYRMAIYNNVDSLLLGWGAAQRFYTFDDELINNAMRPFRSLRPYSYGDTLNIYLSSIGRREYLFWESFGSAANNGGPFATPIAVKSNISGAIGSFTGYAIERKRIVLRYPK
ncbi:MAG: DUF4249 domain-containing protein [Bacteroidia bacterium]|nr:DUF4249 domain-containing protein [Bacteroidia bacterium]